MATSTSFKCCCSCHESPLYHYRKTPDLSLWYKHLDTVVGGNVKAPTHVVGSTIKFETISSGINGGSQLNLSNIPTITTLANMPPTEVAECYEFKYF
jgi:hypothetical protein